MLRLQESLCDQEVVERFRVGAGDFTRTRQLGFSLVVLLILRGPKQALQTTLNKLFTALGLAQQVPCASAICQARQKIKPQLFLHLTRLVTEQFYTLPRLNVSLQGTTVPGAVPGAVPGSEEVLPVLCWHGHRVRGVDGTRWNVPDTPENRHHFGCATNQHTHFACAQASGSILYDLLNDIGLHAAMEPTQSEKELLFSQHLPHTQPGDVLVMDRLYCDYSVLAFVRGHHRHVVVRVPRNSFGLARAFWNSPEVDKVVTLPVTAAQKAWVQEKKLPLKLRVRLVKLTLENGQTEVLMTSLLDHKRYPVTELGQVYGWRWRTQSYIDRLKNIWEVERSNSQKRQHLEQDFYGVLFLSTLESVLTRRAGHELATQSQRRRCRYTQQVNRAVSYSALVDHALVLLTDQGKTPAAVLADLHALFKTSPIPQRTGRHLPREKVSASRKLRHHRYAKRALT